MDLGMIKKLCEKRGINIYELEEICGFGKGSMYSWGRSNPSVDKVKAVADYFGVTVDYLMGDEEEIRTTNKTREEALEYAFRGEPGMKMLFSAAEGATAEEIMQVVEIMKVLRKKNG